MRRARGVRSQGITAQDPDLGPAAASLELRSRWQTLASARVAVVRPVPNRAPDRTVCRSHGARPAYGRCGTGQGRQRRRCRAAGRIDAACRATNGRIRTVLFRRQVTKRREFRQVGIAAGGWRGAGSAGVASPSRPGRFAQSDKGAVDCQHVVPSPQRQGGMACAEASSTAARSHGLSGAEKQATVAGRDFPSRRLTKRPAGCNRAVQGPEKCARGAARSQRASPRPPPGGRWIRGLAAPGPSGPPRRSVKRDCAGCAGSMGRSQAAMCPARQRSRICRGGRSTAARIRARPPCRSGKRDCAGCAGSFKSRFGPDGRRLDDENEACSGA